jgi:hypothetical protein
MAYVLLYGTGWVQRWRVAEAAVAQVRVEIDRVGRVETSQLPVLDPGSGEPTRVVVAWQHVAAAALLDTDHDDTADGAGPDGSYR